MNVATIPRSGTSFLPINVEELYEMAFPDIARFIKSRGGNLEDAKDVFHDGLILFIEKLRQKKRKWNASDQNYLFGICRNLWLHQVRNHKVRSSIDRTLPEPTRSPAIAVGRLHQFIEASGRKCLKLLRACYFASGSMSDIAEDLGYENAHSVSVQKYKCLAKLKSLVEKFKISQNDFME